MLFAENFPAMVKALVLVSPVISGTLSMQTYPLGFLEHWKTKGFFSWEDDSKVKKLKWAFIEDARGYDALEKADKLRMPVVIIVGERDDQTPVSHQNILYERLCTIKSMHIIKGAGHLFKEKEHLAEINTLLDN